MELPTGGFFVRDTWVLDKIVVAKLTNNTMSFYAKPIVAGNL
jgi:hypothetical protein